MIDRSKVNNLMRAHLWLALFYLAVALVTSVLGIVKNWDLQFFSGFMAALAWREADVWTACKRWWPTHSKKVYEDHKLTAELIAATRRPSKHPIFDEMGGKP